MGNPGSSFISPNTLSDSTDAGVSTPIDTSAASMTTHVNPSFGDRLGSAVSSYASQRAPIAGSLFNQVFNAGQAPLPTGTGPAIPGQDDQSAILQQGMHPPQHSGFVKALLSAITGGA